MHARAALHGALRPSEKAVPFGAALKPLSTAPCRTPRCREEPKAVSPTVRVPVPELASASNLWHSTVILHHVS